MQNRTDSLELSTGPCAAFTRNETRASLTHANRAPTACNFFVITSSLFQLRNAFCRTIRDIVDIHSLPLDQLDLCAKEMILWYGNQNGCNSFFLFIRSSDCARSVSAVFCNIGAMERASVTDSIFLIFALSRISVLSFQRSSRCSSGEKKQIVIYFCCRSQSNEFMAFESFADAAFQYRGLQLRPVHSLQIGGRESTLNW